MRASKVIRSDRAAWVIHVFAPSMTHAPSASCRARVWSEPRSDPTSGSVNTAVGSISPLAIRGSQSAFCASVPPIAISSPAISDRVPSDPAPIQPRDNSSVTMHITSLERPSPPNASGMQTPKVPRSAIALHRGVGDQLVGKVPAVRVRQDLGFGEAAKLVADRVEVGIVQRFAGPVAVGERRRDFGPRRGMVGIEQVAARFGERPRRRADAKVGGPEHLVLPHRQAADELADPLGKGERRNLGIERVRTLAGLAPVQHCLQRRHRGRHPRKAMRRALLVIDLPLGQACGERIRRGGAIDVRRLQRLPQIHQAARSKIAAMPCPPPMHIVSSP